MSESGSLTVSTPGSHQNRFTNCQLFTPSLSSPISSFISGMCESIVIGSFGLAPTPPLLCEQVVKCPLCLEAFKEPKVLACFHSFCKSCLERQIEDSSCEKIVCPQCHAETQLSVQHGIESLLNDYGLENVISRQHSDDKGLIFGSPSSTSSSPPLIDSPCEQNTINPTSLCTSCKNGHRASAFCHNCTNYLCKQCTNAHQLMHCFDGHRVDQLSNESSPTERAPPSCKCLQHRSKTLRYFCTTCNSAICWECTQSDHASPAHQYELIDDIADKQINIMESLVTEARSKQTELLELYKVVDASQHRLNSSLVRVQQGIDDAAQLLIKAVEECRRQMMKELDNLYTGRQLQLTFVDKKVQQMSEKLSQTIEFTERLIRYSSPVEVIVFKQLLNTRLQYYRTFNPDMNNILQSALELEYQSVNPGYARQQILNLMGCVRGADWQAMTSIIGVMPPAPICRPNHQRTTPYGSLPCNNDFIESNLIRAKSDMGGSQNGMNFTTMDNGFVSQYEKWSMGIEPSIPIQIPDSPELDQIEKLSSNVYAPRAQIKRQKMIYHCKFGEFGVLEGQFTEPSGVSVNGQNDIVVADTNNHRIQVFDKDGRFKFQFGECGKRDGQLLYPNRVAVNRVTGDFVVTERSPTHQIQIYNQYGQFVRKFGANILQHPRGVCVDNKGRIIVVECKVMRVLIFDAYGNILQKFSCSRHLEFPNGVCTNDKQEILISDNRAHCIKVFNYEGQFVRQIGGEGITNYPIGVGINSSGDIVVADNHNNFNLTVFSQDGTMLSALESKVKHAQCFDVALVEDGSVVLASKDYRLYLYRYKVGNALN